MKLLEAMAFDWADQNCDCAENEDVLCDASALMRGYEAGFRAAREMAAELADRNVWGTETDPTLEEKLLHLGEEDAE